MPTIEVDDYVVDTLMADLVGHDRQPSAFLVYLYLWRHTHSAGEDTAVSLPDRDRRASQAREQRCDG
jgi:hypothetical protein